MRPSVPSVLDCVAGRDHQCLTSLKIHGITGLGTANLASLLELGGVTALLITLLAQFQAKPQLFSNYLVY